MMRRQRGSAVVRGGGGALPAASCPSRSLRSPAWPPHPTSCSSTTFTAPTRRGSACERRCRWRCTTGARVHMCPRVGGRALASTASQKGPLAALEAARLLGANADENAPPACAATPPTSTLSPRPPPRRLDLHPHTGERRNFTVMMPLPWRYQASARLPLYCAAFDGRAVMEPATAILPLHLPSHCQGQLAQSCCSRAHAPRPHLRNAGPPSPAQRNHPLALLQPRGRRFCRHV